MVTHDHAAGTRQTADWSTAAPVQPTDRATSRDQEEALLSCLLADPATMAQIEDIVSWRAFSADRSESAALRDRRAVAEAAWACIAQTPPLIVNRPNVLDQARRLGYLDVRVSAQYIQHLDDRGTADILRGRHDYAERVALLARARHLYRMAMQLADDLRQAPDEVDSLGAAYLDKAAQVVQGSRISRDPTAAAILTNRPLDAKGLPTGLTMLDRVARVIVPARMTAIMARQGGRKTSTALNLLLAPLYAGASVAYFSFRDNTREELLDQIIAMRAVALMRLWHLKGTQPDCGPAHWIISPEGLRKYFRTPSQQLAIAQAEDEVVTKIGDRLRVYDATDGIIDLGRTLGVTRTDIARFRTHLVVYDYMQAMEVDGQTGDGDYAVMRPAVKKLHRLITEKSIASIMISQLNGQDDVRGGGDLRDAATVLLRIGYNAKDRPDAITYEIDKGRFSNLADGLLTYAMNPSSGLILNPAATSSDQQEADYAS